MYTTYKIKFIVSIMNNVNYKSRFMEDSMPFVNYRKIYIIIIIYSRIKTENVSEYFARIAFFTSFCSSLSNMSVVLKATS